MKIVLVMDQSDESSNGTTVTAQRLAANLRNNGHTVTILAGGQPEKGKICAKKHRIPFFQKLIEDQGMCFAKPDPALYYKAFKGADIVHFFMPFRFCREGARHARQMRIPTVAAFHVQPENITSTLFLNKFDRVNSWFYRWFHKIFYNRFDYIHCPSQFIAEQLAENGYEAETRVISNGVSRVFRKIEVERPKELEGKFVIMMTGRLSREKRQDLLIDAVKRSRYADKIHLVFAGKGPTHRKYQRMAKRLPNGAEFRFFSQEELLRQVNMSDLYVHASDVEIEGISCLEAMACGVVPVISNSKLSATGQYALHENSLFEAGNAADLAAKIDWWIEHPEERAALSVQYQRQQDDNRVDICAERMVELYQQVIDTMVEKPFEPVMPGWKKLLAPRPERVNNPVFCESKRLSRLSNFFATNAVRFLLMPFQKLFLGLRVQGKENLKHLDKGAVSVSNHVQMLDCSMAKIPFFSKKFWIISLRENFEMPIVGLLIKWLGAVSLGSSHREQGALQRKLIERLKAGEVVHYFPEGMLIPYYKGIREFHNGAFALAVRAGCPVVPMVFCTSRRGGLYRLKKKPCLTLRVLKPIEPDPTLAPKYARIMLQKQVEVALRREIDAHYRELKWSAQPVFQDHYDTEYADYGDVAYEDESA